jgi:serine/threonine protein kinase
MENASKLNSMDIRRIAAQLFSALQFCHSCNIIHRDVTSKNVMLRRGLLKLIDFGLARAAVSSSNADEPDADDVLMTQGRYVVTLPYRPPECLYDSHLYTCKVDIWSAGIILGEMLTCGKKLFDGRNSVHQLQLIVSSLGRCVIPSDASPFIRRRTHHARLRTSSSLRNLLGMDVEPAAVDLVKLLLQPNQDQRISADEALQHPYLNGYASIFKHPTGEGNNEPKMFTENNECNHLSSEEYVSLIYSEVDSFPTTPPSLQSDRKRMRTTSSTTS